MIATHFAIQISHLQFGRRSQMEAHISLKSVVCASDLIEAELTHESHLQDYVVV